MVSDFDRTLAVATHKHMAGRHAEAESAYRRLICEQPNHPFLNFAFGTLYTDAPGDHSVGMAIPLLMRAVELDPTNAQAWNNLGACFKSAFKNEDAAECLDKAHALDSKNPAVYANYSGLYINEGCPDKCIPWAKRGLLLDPESPQLNNHYALACLEMGNWEDGWRHWEYRTKLPGWYQRDFPEPTKKWHGQPVRNLALSGEQGIGDEILFCSIIPEIRHLVKGTLFIECTARLQTLFERSFGCKTYPSHQELLFTEHEIDAHLQLGSLPRLFRPTPNSCPGTPFLKADPVVVAEMRARLERLGPPPYIGLAWQGGTVKTHAHARRISLADFNPIRGVPGATFVSVQYGAPSLEAAEAHLTHFADAVVDFDRHTALIAACDLIITVCQTAVHQAGGLGVPCWCLTPVKVAWRYGVFGGDRMPWYSSARLFRQDESQQWGPVIDAVAEELLTWIADRQQQENAA